MPWPGSPCLFHTASQAGLLTPWTFSIPWSQQEARNSSAIEKAILLNLQAPQHCPNTIFCSSPLPLALVPAAAFPPAATTAHHLIQFPHLRGAQQGWLQWDLKMLEEGRSCLVGLETRRMKDQGTILRVSKPLHSGKKCTNNTRKYYRCIIPGVLLSN